MIGSRLGQYMILDVLGEGGMGVVYRARDERLQRFVALKFMPRHRSSHAGERERFMEEARSASALNHPNVCTVHDVGEHDDELFIVMELIEGQTLRSRIAQGEVPLEQAVAWAIQIGDALREAHSHGVIHRDIKTENIMLTAHGQAKVMDFGLARLKDVGQATRTTSTLGTLAYMAPEQIREGVSDARSDIYAFGVILYELLTGRQPFVSEQHAAVMYAILNLAHEPLQSVRPGLSSGWQHLVDRALEKDPADRYQTVGEMVIELRRLQRELSAARHPLPSTAPAVAPPAAVPGLSAAHTPPEPTAPTPATAEIATSPPRRTHRVTLRLLTALVVATALAWFIWPKGGPRLASRMTFRTLQLPTSEIGYPGMSKDGKWVAFPAADSRGNWDLYFMNLKGEEPRRITSDSAFAIIYADVSPDGSQIVYSVVRVQPKLQIEVRIVPSLGGTSRAIAPEGLAARFSPDGQRIGYIVAHGRTAAGHTDLWSVRSDGSDRRLEYRDSSATSGLVSFDWSPDGRSIAWLRTFADRSQELFVVPLGNGRERQLTHDGKNIDEVCWTAQNEIVFSSNRGGNSNLWIVSANGGSPKQITKGAGPDIGMRISTDGRTLLYLQHQQMARMWISSLVRPEPRPVPFGEARLGTPALSADGSRIAVPVFEPDPIQPVAHLVIMNRDGSQRRAFTSGSEFVRSVVWGPQGNRLLYVAVPKGEPRDSSSVFVADADAPGSQQMLARATDARWIDSTRVMVTRGGTLIAISLEDGRQEVLGTDSVWTFTPPGATYQLQFDRRRGQQVSVLTRGADGNIVVRPVIGNNDPGYASPRFDRWVRLRSRNRATLVRLPDLAETPIPGSLGPLSTDQASVSWDGREIIYNERLERASLVLIEHLR